MNIMNALFKTPVGNLAIMVAVGHALTDIGYFHGPGIFWLVGIIVYMMAFLVETVFLCMTDMNPFRAFVAVWQKAPAHYVAIDLWHRTGRLLCGPTPEQRLHYRH